MKKYLNIALIILLVFSLTSCFGMGATDDDIENVKDELLNGNNDTNTGTIVGDENVPKYEDENQPSSNSGSTNSNSNTETPANVQRDSYTVNYLGSNQFLEIDNLSSQDFANRKVTISGKTLANVDKVIVNFTNSTSKFPDDNFQLTRFKAGDKTFTYNAFAQYEVLDYGTNEYIIEAYSGDEVSRVEIIINIPEKTTTNTSSNDTTATINSSVSSVEVSPTEIKNLEVGKAESGLTASTSDEITSLLAKITPNNTYFYWNTSRPISNNEGFSVYVLRLDGSNYVYEKYYYLDDGTVGVFQLETGTGVDRDNISEKNSEFRSNNSEYDTSEADEYFKSIL